MLPDYTCIEQYHFQKLWACNSTVNSPNQLMIHYSNFVSVEMEFWQFIRAHSYYEGRSVSGLVETQIYSFFYCSFLYHDLNIRSIWDKCVLFRNRAWDHLPEVQREILSSQGITSSKSQSDSLVQVGTAEGKSQMVSIGCPVSHNSLKSRGADIELSCPDRPSRKIELPLPVKAPAPSSTSHILL